MISSQFKVADPSSNPRDLGKIDVAVTFAMVALNLV
jgi:hypothetical protein